MTRLPSILTALGLIAALVVPLRVSAQSAQSHTAQSGALADVRYIFHNLNLQPPKSSVTRAKKKDPLYDRYGLQTNHGDKASIGFHDGTVLHLNENTQATLSAHVTQVSRGEVAEYLAPGTDHKVQTNSAIASAIGTTYDVKTDGTTTTFVVLHGALQVRNAQGGVVVKSNHQTTVIPNHPPAAPTPADARAAFAWTEGIPTPDLGEDVALDANGGQVVDASSEREGTGEQGKAQYIADGLLSTGWETAQGKVTNQSVTIGFFGGNFYRISDVIIDPGAPYGDPASEDLKDFDLRISTTDTKPDSFTSVFHGTTKQKATLQHFHLPVPVRARYIQLVALSNYGSKNRIAVAEFEAVATTSLFAQPRGITVDRLRYTYVADTNSDRIVKLSPHGKTVLAFGKGGHHPGELNRPYGVALGPDGSIYVADTNNNRVEVFSSRGKFLRTWGTGGVDNGQLSSPVGILVDALGHVYVSDLFRVQKFDSTGKFIAGYGGLGYGTPFFDQLARTSKGNIVTVAAEDNYVLTLSPDLKELSRFGKKGSDPGQFDGPEGVATDAQDNIYVVDTFNSRIQKIAPNDKITTWGSTGYRRGEFFFPSAAATDNHGNVYVSDTLNGRIEKLSTDTGKVRAIWGKFATVAQALAAPGGVAADNRGHIYVTDYQNDRIQVRSAKDGHVLADLGYHGDVLQQKGPALGQFHFPRSVAVDAQGAIYVADTDNNRLQILSNRGPIGTIGGYGSDPGKFKFPYGVKVDRQGNLYVADAFNNRVQKLSPTGAPIWTYGGVDKLGTGPDQMEVPEGIAVDSHGNVYVAEWLGSRIDKLSPDGKLIATWGKQDDLGRAPFWGPEDLAVDSQDNIYVADTGHQAVDKVTPDGKFLAVFDMPGPSGDPAGVAVDAKGFIYVTDSQNSRIVKFAPTGEILGLWD